MTTVTKEMLQQMTAIIAKEVQPEAVILFGSHATGKAEKESDVDLLIIETEPFGAGRDRRKEMTRLWRALRAFEISKDILVYSRTEVEKWRHARNHVIARALNEGTVLYGKS